MNPLEHLPGCTSKSIREIVEERGEKLPPELEDADDELRIQLCEDGCPVLARTKEHALSVARERGWLTEDGFVWEQETA